MKAGGGTLEINSAPVFGQGSAITVNDGAVRLNVSSNTPAPSVGTGVTVTVANGASLELAGTTSVLMDATTSVRRATINNSSTSAVGVHVLDGAVQQVGGIDGSGNVVLDDSTGAATSLTADHINQNSLVIGAGSIFTLAPSDSDGNPMAAAMATLSPGPAARSSATPTSAPNSSGFLVAGSLAPASSFVAASGSLLGAGSATSAPTLSLGGGVSGASVSAVPEPSSIVMFVMAVGRDARRRDAKKNFSLSG